MKLADALRRAEKRLAEAAIDTPQLDARLLVEHALGIDRNAILTQAERSLTDDEINRIESLITRRAAHEPVGRIIGLREFWSLNFGINEATLEPRPDSECLVEAALKSLKTKLASKNTSFPRKRESSGKCLRTEDSSAADAAGLDSRLRGNDVSILDLGTGTGCLLLALLHELPEATGVGIDIAPRAVEQARANAVGLNLANRTEFRTGNWLEGIAEKFDAIVSNPPYIPAAAIPGLMPEVREHDPMLALDGGVDGLAAYRLLAPQLPRFLKPDGFVAFEVGAGQAQDVAEICRRNGFAHIVIHKDYSGIERCVEAQISLEKLDGGA